MFARNFAFAPPVPRLSSKMRKFSAGGLCGMGGSGSVVRIVWISMS